MQINNNNEAMQQIASKQMHKRETGQHHKQVRHQANTDKQHQKRQANHHASMKSFQQQKQNVHQGKIEGFQHQKQVKHQGNMMQGEQQNKMADQQANTKRFHLQKQTHQGYKSKQKMHQNCLFN